MNKEEFSLFYDKIHEKKKFLKKLLGKINLKCNEIYSTTWKIKFLQLNQFRLGYDFFTKIKSFFDKAKRIFNLRQNVLVRKRLK